MKTLGKIFLFLVFAAVVSLVYYRQVLNQAPIQIPTKTILTTLTYKNDEYQFEVTYNKQYKLSTEDDQDYYFKSGGKTLATISIPQSLYPKTNLGTAAAVFSAKSKSTEADCQTYLTSANKTKKMTETVTVGDQDYYVDTFDGAAAGTKYDTKLYRVFHTGRCFEINLKVGISNIQNYEPGAVTEVTLAEILPKLEKIVETFKFTDLPETSTDEPGTLTGHMDAPSKDAYDLTQIIVYTSNRSEIVTKINLDSSGDYGVDLPPGIYYVSYTSIYNTFQPPMKKIIILSGESVNIDFSLN